MKASISIISDVDGVLRQNKEPIGKQVIQAIKQVARGVNFSALSGAPIHHLKDLFEIPITVFGEMGGVKRNGLSGEIKIDEKKRKEIKDFKEIISLKKENGLTEIKLDGRSVPVIVEGPRFTSICILGGNPPHYPWRVPPIMEKVVEKIEEIIERHGFKLSCIPGSIPEKDRKSKKYNWLEIVSVTKEETVRQLIKETQKVYYIGDGTSDFRVMEKLPGIIPVAIENSIPEIQKIAKGKGIFINKPGPQGFLEFIEKHIL